MSLEKNSRGVLKELYHQASKENDEDHHFIGICLHTLTIHTSYELSLKRNKLPKLQFSPDPGSSRILDRL